VAPGAPRAQLVADPRGRPRPIHPVAYLVGVAAGGGLAALGWPISGGLACGGAAALLIRHAWRRGPRSARPVRRPEFDADRNQIAVLLCTVRVQ
jgi:hypothetical protein